MHLAFLTHEPFFPPSGGGSAAAGYLVQELVRRGHRVAVFGPALPDNDAVEARFGIRHHGFAAWKMGRTTPLRTPKYLLYPAALARFVQRTLAAGARYDGLIAQHSIASVAAGLVKRRTGIPVVFNLLDCLTGFLETWPPYLMPPAAARALVRFELSLPTRYQADGVMTVSDALADRIVRGGTARERVCPIYYGFDAALFRHAPAPRNESDAPVVVMHGSFDHHHLGPIALRAVRDVASRRPDVRFRFVGPRTPALRKFLAQARSITPAGTVFDCPGFTPYAQIPARLADADLGITPYEPSTGTHCAFVAKTVEYLALGLPVVSTPLESAVRYYRDVAAVKFSAPDGADFGDLVARWLELPMTERSAAVEPARRKVNAELDWRMLCGRAAEFVEATLRPTPR